MKASVALGKIAQLEQKSADLYAFYAEIFENVPGAQKFFLEMQKEEIEHRDQILFQKRLLKTEDLEFDFAEEEMESVMRSCLEIEEHISSGVFEINDALKFAISLEQDSSEVQLRTKLARISPQMGKLVNALKNGDTAHIQSLKSLASRFEGRSSMAPLPADMYNK